MAIREVKVIGENRGIRFPEHKLAHDLLDGKQGIEVGAAAHNPFNLKGSINVAPKDEEDFYQQSQVDMCGSFAVIDVYADADTLPFEDNTHDYVISSHVVEHFCDPMKALREWNRVLKDGGIVFMIVPVRGALDSDKDRPYATFEDWLWASGGMTPDLWDYEKMPVPGGKRGHYFVYSPDTLQDLVLNTMTNWELVAREDKDTKVGNGFTLVFKVNKPVIVSEPLWESARSDGQNTYVDSITYELKPEPLAIAEAQESSENLLAEVSKLVEGTMEAVTQTKKRGRKAKVNG